MPIKIYNTMTRRKEDFVPIDRNEVRIYVCGVTVYDLSHIGHARSALVFDMIRRYLRFRGYGTRFVRNYTDVDDKIIRRANAEGVSPREISERFIEAERADMASLGLLPPDVEPRATDHIPQMIELIEGLIRKGLAYTVDGDVYFEVRRYPPYGRLSGKNLDDLLAGARVEVDERKRDPRDFALWKSAKPGEPSWESPWGAGRPGWHVECSAMAMKHLGEAIDIHGGGIDLIFPHHECEIAQTEGITGKPFCRYWAHNGMINLGAEKMSKSLGNTLSIRELVKRHEPEALRLYLLGTHYRNSFEFAEERVEEAARALGRLRGVVVEAERLAARGTPPPGSDHGLFDEVTRERERFETAMDDDFNSPQALGVLFDLARTLQSARAKMGEGRAGAGAFLIGAAELVTMARSLGLLEARAEAAPAVDGKLKAHIDSLIWLREEARKKRDFVEADRLRAELDKMNVVLEDSREGTTWRLRR